MLCVRGVHPGVNANLVSVSYFREGKDSCPYTYVCGRAAGVLFHLTPLQSLYDTHNIAGSVFNSPKLNFFIFVRTDSYQMVVLMCIAP